MSWTVYLLRCADETLYCGIARDLEARLAAHARGKGARYTRGRGPLVLLASRRCREMGAALRSETSEAGKFSELQYQRSSAAWRM